MSEPERELVKAALERLGIAGTPELSALPRAKAQAVLSYIESRRATCACGQSVLLPDDASEVECPSCSKKIARTTRVAETLPPIGPGTRLGPLEIQEAIGAGAVGTVYRARHLALGRESAVKVISLAGKSPLLRARFERETTALGRLSHPGIVRVHAVHALPGAFAVEMELAPGETLEARIQRAGPIAWREAARLVASLARAVEHAHASDVLHRDLKPANVLLRSDDGRAVVLDFGLARLEDERSSLTETGTPLGTPLYMAPEAFEGEATKALDVYGLGVILHEALAGRPPFEAPSLDLLFRKIARGECEPTNAPGAPAELDRIRARAMNPIAARRFASAADLACALEALVARPDARRARLALPWVALAALVGLGLFFARAPSSESKPGATDAIALARERVRSCRERGAPLVVSDLQELARIAPRGELEELASYALARGLSGDGRDVVRALARANPRAHAIATLLALTLARSGDASARDEVRAALASGAPLTGVSLRLSNAIAATDALARALERNEPLPHDSLVTLPLDLPEVARALERSPALVLEPLATGLRRAWSEARLERIGPKLVVTGTDDVSVGLLEDRHALAALLDSIKDFSPPHLVAVREAAWTGDERPFASEARLEAAGEDARQRGDPLVAAAAFDAVARVIEYPRVVPDERAIASTERCEASLAQVGSLGQTEALLAEILRHRCRIRRASLDEAAAQATTDTTERRVLRERALGFARQALERSSAEFALSKYHGSDVRRVVRLAFAADQLDVAEPLLDDFPQRLALKAEIARRRGDPRAALAIALPASKTTPDDPDLVAVIALASADAGDLAGAREAAKRLARLKPPFLESLRASEVERHLKSRQNSSR